MKFNIEVDVWREGERPGPSVLEQGVGLPWTALVVGVSPGGLRVVQHNYGATPRHAVKNAARDLLEQILPDEDKES